VEDEKGRRGFLQCSFSNAEVTIAARTASVSHFKFTAHEGGEYVLVR
jgi:hypothetical protein